MRRRLQRVVGERLGEPVAFGGRRVEGGVDHAERPQHALGDELAEALARHDLQHAAEHVGRQAVFPRFARLTQQRQRGEPVDLLGRRLRQVDDVGLGDEPVHRRAAGEAVGQPGGVAHQVVDRDRPLGGDELERAVAFDADLHRGEGGQVFGDRVGKQQPSFFDQGHRGDADDRLGHRIDAEDRVVRHRRAAGPQRAEPLGIGDAAVARDQRRDAGGAAGGDFALHRLAEARQGGARQADLFRLGGRQAKLGLGGVGKTALPADRSIGRAWSVGAARARRRRHSAAAGRTACVRGGVERRIRTSSPRSGRRRRCRSG